MSQLFRNNNTDNESYFTTRAFRRFFIPSMISSLGLAFSGIMDAVVIGWRVGESGLAAIGFALPIYMVFNTFDVGLAVGGALHYTRKLADGKAKEAVNIFNNTSFIALLLSLLIAGLGLLFIDPFLHTLGAGQASPEAYAMTREYSVILIAAAPIFFFKHIFYHFVRSDDDPKLASAGLLIGNAVDLVLNFVLVLGLDMGVAGAIWSTVAGSAISITICQTHLWYKWAILRFARFKFSLMDCVKVFSTGLAGSSVYIYQFFGLAFLNNLMVRIAGVSGVAVLDMVINVSFVVMAVAEGSAATVQPMAGTYYGEKDIGSIRRSLSLAATRGFVIAIILTAGTAIFAPEVCAFFGIINPVTVGLGVYAVRLFCLSSIFAFFNVLLSAYFQSVERERISYIISLLRSCALLLPLSLLCSHYWGVYGFWWAYVLTEILTLLFWLIDTWRRRGLFSFKGIDEDRILSLQLTNQMSDLGAVLAAAEEFNERFEASMSQSYYVNLTIEEICEAIIANAFTEDVEGYIQLTLIAEEQGDFVLHIRDNARSFNPFAMNTRSVGLDDESGLEAIGVLIVKKKAKEFFYRRYQGFNTLVIRV